MKPDNRLSRFIRPSLIVWLTLFISVLAVLDGNFFNIVIKDIYIKELSAILMVGFTAYIAGKSYEHGARINKGEHDVE